VALPDWRHVPVTYPLDGVEVGVLQRAHREEFLLGRGIASSSHDPDGPPSNEHPNSHDYSQLVSIYSHTDSFNTPTFAGLAGESPASWGTLVDGAAGHGVATYVREHGHGNYVVTHVFWAN